MTALPKCRSQTGRRGSQDIRGAARAVDPAAGVGVAEDFLLERVPADGAVEALGEAVQMADGGGAVADFGGADRLAAGLDAFEPIPFVVGRFVKVELARRQGAVLEFGRGGLQPGLAAD